MPQLSRAEGWLSSEQQQRLVHFRPAMATVTRVSTSVTKGPPSRSTTSFKRVFPFQEKRFQLHNFGRECDSLWQFRIGKKFLLKQIACTLKPWQPGQNCECHCDLIKVSCSKTSSSKGSYTEAISAETRDSDATEAKLKISHEAVILRQIQFRGTKAPVLTSMILTRMAATSESVDNMSHWVSVNRIDEACDDISDLKKAGNLRVASAAIDSDHVRHLPVVAGLDDHSHPCFDVEENRTPSAIINLTS